jgi:hypothetical protein
MEGLLRQLSLTNPDAESAIGWVVFFDHLVERHADLRDIVRSTAGTASCVAGFCCPNHHLSVWIGPDGRELDSPPTSLMEGSSAKIIGDHAGEAWVLREIGPSAHDDVIVERFALAISLTLDRLLRQKTQFDEGEALADLLAIDQSESDRLTAAYFLGVTDVEAVRVLVVDPITCAGSEEVVSASDFAEEVRAQGEIAKTTTIGNNTVVLTTSNDFLDILPHVWRTGVGSKVSPLMAQKSWKEAMTALRFTTPRKGMQVANVVRFEDLGVLSALAEVPITTILEFPEVKQLNEMAKTRTGQDVIMAIDSYCRLGSMRGAGSELFLHHTSVAGRLEHASESFGYSVADAAGMLRARIALALWQISGE